MNSVNETDALNEAIIELEQKRSEDLIALRAQFCIAYESIKPLHLIKSTIAEVTSSHDLQKNIANQLIGLTTGYLSRVLLMGTSRNPLRKIAGTLLQLAITNVASKHASSITSTGEKIFHHVIDSMKNKNKSVAGFNR